MDISRKILSDIIIHSKYARFIPELNRRETWDEIVTRNMDMHIAKFPFLEEEIRKNYQLVFDRKVLPSMRGLQFGGKAIELANARQYNCSYMPVDDIRFFRELMALLMYGCGVGYSVQLHHIEKLPAIVKPLKKKKFQIEDSIIGWAQAVESLINAYFGNRKALPIFDFRNIRPQGTPLKTSGGIAPGPKPLEKLLFNINQILETKETGEQLTSLEAHEIACHIADGVLAGGIRRSAMICLFSFGDSTMMHCKSGNWWEAKPHLGRANNSVVLIRSKALKRDFDVVFEAAKNSGSGEPGIFFSNDKEFGLNPCGEAALRAHQYCNLCSINVSTVKDQHDFELRSIAASFIGTIQASYTDFYYLRSEWERVTAKDALLGISMTGIASKSVLGLDFEKAALLVKEENSRVAQLIGINEAARTTMVKPEGTSSLVLGCSYGIHAWHSPYYIRRVTINKNEPIYPYLVNKMPELIEDNKAKEELEAFLCVPQKAPDDAVLRSEPAIDLLERVKNVYLRWIKPGHRSGANTHNVSATISAKNYEWDSIQEWMWDNKDSYASLTVFPYSDHIYSQPPYEEISEEQYNSMIKHLVDIDLSQVSEINDNTNLKENWACSGGSCEIL